MSRRKEVTVRITKVRKGFYTLEQKTRFLFLFPMWVHGSPTLRLPYTFSKFNIAQDACWQRGKELNLSVNIEIG